MAPKRARRVGKITVQRIEESSDPPQVTGRARSESMCIHGALPGVHVHSSCKKRTTRPAKQSPCQMRSAQISWVDAPETGLSPSRNRVNDPAFGSPMDGG